MAQPRRRSPVRPAPRAEAGTGERLAFFERLHNCSLEVDCAEDTLAWLRGASAVPCGLVALLDAQESRLVLLAAQGFAPGSAEALLADDSVRPLLVNLAYEGGGPVRLRPQRASRPFSVVRDLHAIALSPDARAPEGGQGVLVVESPDASGPLETVTWAARLLGHRLRSVGYARLLHEHGRAVREKAVMDTVLDAVTDPVLFTDQDGRIVVANSAAERLLTVAEADSEGRRRAVALNNMIFSASLARTGGAAAPREMPLVDPAEGRDLLYEAISTPASVGRGESGAITVLRDVTDLRRASEEIEENYRRLRTAEAEGRSERDRLALVLDSVAEPVLVTDPFGVIQSMNPPAERLFTVPSAAPLEAQQRVATNDAVMTSFLGNLSASPQATWRGRLLLADPSSGASVPMEAISGEIRSRQGDLTAVVTILHDLTEALEREALYYQVKRQSEELGVRVREATAELAGQNERLRRQTLELEQASAMKSQFLANISHELRTPLNAILGYTHLLSEGTSGPINEAQAEKVRRLNANAQHLLALINDLLDIARIEAGKMPVHSERFAIPTLIEEVVRELEPLIPSTGIAFSVALAPRLPELATDRQKVKQIIVNLLSNALKFTPSGSVEIRAGRSPGGGVTVAVKDTGVGISAENQSRIFEAFATGDRRGGMRGTGLGLAISRRLASVLDGRIELESRLGVGSIFTLQLPAAAEARAKGKS